MPVAVFVTVTVTRGTTAPVESSTVPVSVPRIVCAAEWRAVTPQTSRTLRARRANPLKPVSSIVSSCSVLDGPARKAALLAARPRIEMSVSKSGF
jgi:hypothetical protein